MLPTHNNITIYHVDVEILRIYAFLPHLYHGKDSEVLATDFHFDVVRDGLVVGFDQSGPLKEGLADEGEGKLQDVIFAEEYFEEGDVVGALVDVLEENFFQNFIVVVFANSGGDVLKDAEIQIVDFFL